ncbi:LOW QUALITY PROTEIN: inositol polyphosphate 5-phosphatase K [Erpetoichthys calabaricus]|uniref:LOW QUALITY PROTEIN: inositol polyphosphate 5-phosphatase K n=1 Tax=Erpetoichthys calabaricus TaxID=27687 RepID=UPI00223458A1|nr:LOW QUALITY PROTEIN: inositol polyphosphate 5-phosphatase K [Erpetoichthys calabaricus]
MNPASEEPKKQAPCDRLTADLDAVSQSRRSPKQGRADIPSFALHEPKQRKAKGNSGPKIPTGLSLAIAADEESPDACRFGQGLSPTSAYISPSSSRPRSPVHAGDPVKSADSLLKGPGVSSPTGFSSSLKTIQNPTFATSGKVHAAPVRSPSTPTSPSVPELAGEASFKSAVYALGIQYPESSTSGKHGDLKMKEATEPMGENEDDDFRIHIVTWNVAAATPPDDITSLLGLNVGDGRTDMYIIGLQEVNSMINKRLKDAIFTDQWSELCMDSLASFGYVMVTSQRMQGVLLLILAKYYHLPFLRDIQTETTRTGLGGYWGNKGGVSARMSVFGHMVCFLNCHLPAHMENSEQRMEDFESILQQQFDSQSATSILDHDVVFWFGDLNFRIEDYDMNFVKYAIDSNKLSMLWEKDQLNMAKTMEPVLEGFHEGVLRFPPTYKFDVGTSIYDTSAKKRKPAWTDRILWKTKNPESKASTPQTASKRHSGVLQAGGLVVSQHSYRSHMEYAVSDHKPVSSIFTLKFPYKIDVPFVQLAVEDEWNAVSDAIVRYKMAQTFPRSSWDWIGLYKVGFRHQKDYVSYVWAKHEDPVGTNQHYQVSFTEESLPKGSGEYILGYYSNNLSTIVGVTEPFQISLPTSSPSSSPSDSSEYSSEDDSTLVLLRTKSRSPSPGKARQRGRRSRSRSPVLPKLQGLNLRPKSRDKSKGRSPSPRAGHGSKRERLVPEPEAPVSMAAPPSRSSGHSRPGIEVTTPEPNERNKVVMRKTPDGALAPSDNSKDVGL